MRLLVKFLSAENNSQKLELDKYKNNKKYIRQIKNMEFIVLIEKDEDGYYVAEVPSLKGCYTQGKSLEEVMKRIKEVISLCLEDQSPTKKEFIGVHKIEVPL